MAVAQPVFVTVTAGQDASVTVRLSASENVADWTVTATVRAYHGQTALITKTLSSGITIANEGNGAWTITFTDTELSITPGAYIFEFRRTNDGYEYPICDPSCFLVRSEASATTPKMTNLSEYLAWKGESMIVSDDVTQRSLLALAVAEDTIERTCHRKFTYASSIVEYLDGTGTQDVMLKRTPVQSVTSVYLDTTAWYGSVSGSFDSSALLASGTDYVLVPDDPDNSGWSRSGILRRMNYIWPTYRKRPTDQLTFFTSPARGCLKVTYVGGWSLLPMDLKMAVWDTATLMLNASTRGRPFMSENFEDYGYSLMGLEEDAKRIGSVANVIMKYRAGCTFVR